MSDNQSQKSSRSSRHAAKICAYDGKEETNGYYRHNKRHHQGLEPKLWIEGEPLLDKPWCTNWEDVIYLKAKPYGIINKFKPGTTYKSGRSNINGSNED